jgi:hypothetical protein
LRALGTVNEAAQVVEVDSITVALPIARIEDPLHAQAGESGVTMPRPLIESTLSKDVETELRRLTEGDPSTFEKLSALFPLAELGC